jgi:serine/threonine-protein kinase
VAHPLTDVRAVDDDVEAHLERVGRVFRRFLNHDSHCTSWGVEIGGRRWFVKHSDHPRGLESLRRAVRLHTRAAHPALARLRNTLAAPGGGLALVYDWLPGELLYDGYAWTAEGRRADPACPHVRFRTQPLETVLAGLDTIYDAHLYLADLGLVAVDLYDGCFLWDFEARRMSLCDLDEYRPGPFVLEADRLPGSTRFMAPEEFERGARIDGVTNVFALGRTAAVLLGDGTGSLGAWRGTDRMRAVAERATSPARADRYPSVRAFVDAWRRAVRA